MGICVSLEMNTVLILSLTFFIGVVSSCHYLYVHTEDKNTSKPVNTSLWRDNFYLIPNRPPGNEYAPPLLPSGVAQTDQTTASDNQMTTQTGLSPLTPVPTATPSNSTT